MPQKSPLGLRESWVGWLCLPSPIHVWKAITLFYSLKFHKRAPAMWFPTHSDKKYKITISYQIISSQHLFLHIWNCPQSLQIRKVVFHHKRDWGSIVTGDEPRGQSQQALLQTGNWRKSAQFLNRHYGILGGRKHGITLLTTWHITPALPGLYKSIFIKSIPLNTHVIRSELDYNPQKNAIHTKITHYDNSSFLIFSNCHEYATKQNRLWPKAKIVLFKAEHWNTHTN